MATQLTDDEIDAETETLWFTSAGEPTTPTRTTVEATDGTDVEFHRRDIRYAFDGSAAWSEGEGDLPFAGRYELTDEQAETRHGESPVVRLTKGEKVAELTRVALADLSTEMEDA